MRPSPQSDVVLEITSSISVVLLLSRLLDVPKGKLTLQCSLQERQGSSTQDKILVSRFSILSRIFILSHFNFHQMLKISVLTGESQLLRLLSK